MHGLSSLALWLAFAPAPIAPERTELSADECRERELDFFVGFGSGAAPTLLEVYIDPIQSNSLQVWLEARRIVGERDGELRLELIPTRGGVAKADAESDSVRLWFVAAAALGYAEEALRLLDSQDWQRVAAQIRTREGRAKLSRELGIDPEQFELRRGGAAGACLSRSFERMSDELARQTMGQRAMVVGIVGRDGKVQIKYTDTQLSELRTQLERVGIAPVFIDGAVATEFVAFPRHVGSKSSRFDRTFPNTGLLVGGDALPHRLLIFVEDEEHGRLPDWLAPAMRYRDKNPGELAVQVIAAGVGSRAIGFRRRLCAARTLGLEVEYMLHLAERPAVRRLHEADLYAALQPVADSDACSDSEPLDLYPAGAQSAGGADAWSAGGARHGRDFGLPRGAWLDGRPVSPADLENLGWLLGSDLAPSVIDWLMIPAPFIGEAVGFEF